jgi:alpha-D-ribose 1-methylphosphonate 5-triphosphate synthase subunit PhnH
MGGAVCWQSVEQQMNSWQAIANTSREVTALTQCKAKPGTAVELKQACAAAAAAAGATATCLLATLLCTGGAAVSGMRCSRKLQLWQRLSFLQGPTHLSSQQQPQQALRQRLSTTISRWQGSLQQQQHVQQYSTQQLSAVPAACSSTSHQPASEHA